MQDLTKKREFITYLKSDVLADIIQFLNFTNNNDAKNALELILLTKITNFKYLHDISFANYDHPVLIEVEKEIDDIIYEAYYVYVNITPILFKMPQGGEVENELILFEETLKRYEHILETYNFKKANTIGIQKQYYQTVLNKQIKLENYEYCDKIVKLIKKLK